MTDDGMEIEELTPYESDKIWKNLWKKDLSKKLKEDNGI
jgi:hypothetical protein